MTPSRTLTGTLGVLLVLCLAAPGCKKRPPVVEEPDVAVDLPDGPASRAARLKPLDRPDPDQPIPGRLIEPGEWRRVQHGDGSVPKTTKTLEVTGSVAGEDGRPAAGSRVVLISHNTFIAATTSAVDGRFTLGFVPMPIMPQGPPASGPAVFFRLYVYAADRALAVTSEDLYVDAPRPAFRKSGGFYLGEKIDVPIKHGPAASVRGRIADAQGKPVARATVRIVSIASIGTSQFSNEGWDDPGLVTKADDDGQFRLGNLPPKTRFTVEVRAPGFACTQVVGDTTPLASGTTRPPGVWNPARGDVWPITLTQPLLQHVQVTDRQTSKPLAGFDVVAVLSVTTPSAVAPRAHARTDGNGYAALWLPPGGYDLTVDPGDDLGYLPGGMHGCLFDATTVDKPERIDLSPRVVTIEMVDPENKPVRGGVVQLHLTYGTPPNERPGMPGTYFWGPTKSDGTFRGRNPFDSFTIEDVAAHRLDCRFEVKGPDGYETVFTPDVSLAHLMGTNRPTFRFVVRKRAK